MAKHVAVGAHEPSALRNVERPGEIVIYIIRLDAVDMRGVHKRPCTVYFSHLRLAGYGRHLAGISYLKSMHWHAT